MTASNELAEPARRLRRAGAALAALAPRIEASRPWPLSEDVGHTPESHWGPPETLAHVAEMLPYWAGEMERILDAPADGGPVMFGRVATNPLRIAVLERDRSLPLRELFARIDDGVERLSRRMESLSPSQAARTGVHQTLGELSLADVASRFVVSHLEEHVDQLQTALEEAG